MARISRFSLLLLAVVSCALPAKAQSPPRLFIPRVARPPKLEDFLNGTPREAEARVTDFRQYKPGDGIPVTQETTAYLSYDDKNLYVIFVCKDEPGQVRARLAKREDILSDDFVAINLDTFRDRQRYYNFRVNGKGVQQDSIYTEGQGLDSSFDTLWHSEGRLTPDGYIVLMAIPFKSLRFPDSLKQSWGVYICRQLRRNDEVSCWPYVTQRVEGTAQQMATLDGLEQISPGRNLQFIPYGTFAHARFLDTQIPKFRSDNEARFGLDAKVVLRDAITLDFALNPDFSQVESDEPQVTVNQRFEVFFPEKRPFFIENAGFFQTPINLFFSRRIADPQYGARLTGKVGRWALGALLADDRAPGKSVPTSDPLRGRRAGLGVVSVRREFGQQSSLGLLVTSRDFASSSNRVFSLDARLKLNPNWVLAGQLMRSHTRELDGSRRAEPAYWTELSYTGRHFVYAGRYNDRSPDFRSQFGFIPRVDIRQTEQSVTYYWRPENSRVLLFGPDVLTVVNWNRQGQVQDWFVDASFGADLKGPTGLGCRHVNAFELFQGHGFRRRNSDCGINTAWLKWLELTADYGWGTSINFFPGPGLSPFLAQVTSAKLGFILRPSPRLRIEETYLYTRLNRRGGSTLPGISQGMNIFNNHILRAKLNYQFTRELSLRAIFDYNAVLANPSLVALERSKRFTADFLVTYLLNPGTALYIGYTDRYESLNFDPAAPTLLRRTGGPTTPIGRQFFVKMSYLFRF